MRRPRDPAPSAAADLLATSERDVLARLAGTVDLAGRRVLEIGGAAPAAWVQRHGVATWYAVDPRHSDVDEPPLRVREGRAERLDHDDATFDVVFSCNAFQFVGDLTAALAEIRRVLVPGGLLYAQFGPIWSAPDGHQLEGVRYRGETLVFWRDHYLPPWSHLLFGPEELRAILGTRLEPDLRDLLVRHVHDSPLVNRLFFEDYVERLLASGLDLLRLRAGTAVDYPLRCPPYDHPLLSGTRARDVRAAVAARHGGRPRNIDARDLEIVAQAPARRHVSGS